MADTKTPGPKTLNLKPSDLLLVLKIQQDPSIQNDQNSQGIRYSRRLGPCSNFGTLHSLNPEQKKGLMSTVV